VAALAARRRSGAGTQRAMKANVSDAQTGHCCVSWTLSQSRHRRAILSCMLTIDLLRSWRLALSSIAHVKSGDFFGEGALTGQSIRIGTATATMPTTVFVIEKGAMLRLLHDEPTFSDRFISYMLERNLRIEADLVDHLFNSSEKRLARTLLLLARYGDQAGEERKIPRISQETLAEMIGTTRSRVNFFMNKFRDLGFIEYNGGLTINTALLGIVLHD
jgi:CRP/FNR family transcriptional regulator, cyclic AMP receptor protein